MNWTEIFIPEFGSEPITVISVVVRVVIAVILGGAIGIERGVKNHPAGFRTHILVCIGACLVMLTNEFVFSGIEGPADPTRMGAQVISGIGFLGIGTIFMAGRGTIKGLTTAAGLWASACVGLAIGVGFYAGGIAATLIIIIVLGLLPKLESQLHKYSKTIVMYVEVVSPEAIGKMTDYISESGHSLKEKQINSISKKENTISLSMTVRLKNDESTNKVVEELSEIDDVILIELL